MSAVAWKEELIASRKSCKTSPAELVDNLRSAQSKLAKSLKRLGLESTYQAEQQAKYKLRSLFYSNWLSASYPVIDLSFAESTISLMIERTADGAKIVGLADREASDVTETVAKISRFAKQHQDETRGRDLFSNLPEPMHRLGKFSFPAFQKNREKFRDYSGHVCCNRPEGSPNSLIRKFRDIAAIMLEARAAAIRAGVGIESASLGRTFLWEPRLQDLYITEQIPVRDDPAVLVTCGDRAHLVAFWDSPEENPIEGLLREFSEGSFENVG